MTLPSRTEMLTDMTSSPKTGSTGRGPLDRLDGAAAFIGNMDQA